MIRGCYSSGSPERHHMAFKAPNHTMFQSLRSTSLSQKSLPVPGLGQVPKPRSGVRWPAGPTYLFGSVAQSMPPLIPTRHGAAVQPQQGRGSPSTDSSAFWEQTGAKRTRPVYMEVLEVVYGS